MKPLLIGLFILFFGMNDHSDADDFYMPGEWEQQEAVWVGIFQRAGRDTVMAEIIRSLHNNVQVRLNYTSASFKTRINLFLSTQQIDTSRLEWIKDELYNSWVRDPGPLFLVNKKGDQKVIDFGWNGYGKGLVYNYSTDFLDSMLDQNDVRMAGLQGLPVVGTRMVAEGGGIETNGAGVLMSTEETALQRNPGKTLKEIEEEYLRVTHCKKMIWLKRMMLHDKSMKGILVGNWFSGGANGHIDEVARFVSPTTIALAKIDEEEKDKNPISRADYEILEEYYATLKKATDINGKPFTIVRIPAPDLVVYSKKYVLDDKLRRSFEDTISTAKNGDTLYYVPAISYMNFFASNNVVLIARYWKEGLPLKEKQKDEEVRTVMQKIYPDRKIIQIDPISINGGGGGIHCVTLQQPLRKK